MAAPQQVYLHGQPGSAAELRLFAAGQAGSGRLYAPDRNRLDVGATLEAALDSLAAEIGRRFSAGPVQIVGFSLGAFVAVEVAIRLADAGRNEDLTLDLISPAAPLSLGDFTPHMAGGPIFELARKAPAAFGLATGAQRLATRLAPGLLYRQLFAAAAGADADLAHDPDFAAIIRAVLGDSLGPVYRREILGYVQWPRERLAALDAPITVWQGEADTWTPPAMARGLAAARPRSCTLNLLPGLSHYSTLKAVAPRIGLA